MTPEKATRRNEDLLNATERLTKVGGWEWNVDQQSMFWTDETYRIHEIDPDSIQPGSQDHINTSLACYNKTDRPVILAAFKSCVDTGEPYDLQFPFTTTSGRNLWIRTTAQPILKDGKVTRVIGNIQDVTEQRQVQEKLAESRRRLWTLMANLPGMAYRCLNDKSWTMKFVSNGCYELTGYLPEHLIDNRVLTYAELIYPDDRKRVWDEIQNSLAQKNQFNIVYRLKCANGTLKWVMEKGQGIFSKESELEAIEGFITDVNDRRRAEEELRVSEEKFRLVFQTSPDSININRFSDGTYVDVNDGFIRLTGYSRDEVLGKTTIDLNIWENPEDRKKLIAALKDYSHLDNFEARFRKKNGDISTGLMSARIIDLNNEKFILSITRDISDLKRAAQEAEEHKAKYQRIVESSTDAILMRTRNIIDYANPAAVKLFKAATAEDLFGRNYLHLVHPDDRAESLNRIRKSTEENWNAPPREHRILTMDGQVVFVESTGVAVKHGNSTRIFGIFRDVTERKKMEESLRETENKYRELTESLPQVIFEVDINGILTYVNQTGQRAFGYTKEELAQSFNVLDAFIPDDRQRVTRDILLNIQGQRLGRQEYTALRKDGSQFPVGVHANRVMCGSNPVGVKGILIDLTESKMVQAEKKRLELQLQQAHKMEAIGALAGGIAHDFNNILSIIIGYTELAIINDEPKCCTSELRESLKASLRAKDLVKQILAFSRQTDEEKKAVNVGMMAKEAIKFMRATVPSTIEIKGNITDSASTAFANPVELHQIILNLCTNAVHAMGHSGTLEIGVQAVQHIATPDSDLREGSYICLSVKDTGQGIAPQYLDRIFDPYFTTKEKGVGTGLGLAVVHGIVKKYGGGITVDSKPQIGTIFNVYLPKMSVSYMPQQEKAIIVGGTERILFIDDEKMLADIGMKALQPLGYSVTTRTSPFEALELFKAKPDHFDLIITDQTMPGMTGDALANELMRIRPGLPVVICTGYSETLDQNRASSMGITGFVMKPLLIHEIAAAIRKALQPKE